MIRQLIHIAALALLAGPLHGQYTFENFKHLTADDGLPGTYSFGFTEDKDGFIWIATIEGLARYDGSKVYPFEPLPTDSVSLPSNYIMSLLASGDSLWIGTGFGLAILDLSDGHLSSYYLDATDVNNVVTKTPPDHENAIWDLHEDRQGDIWMAASHNGFVKYEKKSRKFIQYNIEQDEHIPDVYPPLDRTTIKDIIQDVEADSIMWGAGIYGIVRLNTSSGTTSRILYGAGSTSDNYHINRKICLYQDSAGILYSGAWNTGFSIFDPVTKQYDHPQLKTYNFDGSHQQRGHLFSIFPGEPGTLLLSYGDGLREYNIADGSLRVLKNSSFKTENEIRFGVDFIDSKGRIWCGSGGGVVVADPLEHQFNWYDLSDMNPTSYEVLPRAIVEDFYPGYVTVTGQYTDGIYHVNMANGHRMKHRYDKIEEGRPFSVWGMDRLDENRLVMARDGKLYYFNKSTNKFSVYKSKTPAVYNSLFDNVVDDYGVLWQGTRRDGLLALNTETGKFKVYAFPPRMSSPRNLHSDVNDNIWFGTGYGHGVYDRQRDTMYLFDIRSDSSKTFFDGRKFCECPNGEIWMASKFDGIGLMGEQLTSGIVKKFVLKDSSGNAFDVRGIACNANNELWCIGPSGIARFSRSYGIMDIFTHSYGIKKWSGLFQFLDNGDLFISSRDAFYTVKPDQLKTNTLLPRPYVGSVVTNDGTKNQIEEHLKRTPVEMSAREDIMTIEFSAINHTLGDEMYFQYKLEGIDEKWLDPGNNRALTYTNLPGGDYVFKLKAANNEGIWNKEVYELPVFIATPWHKTNLFWIFIGLVCIGIVYFIYRYRISQIQQANELKSSFEKKVANLEMSALRAQMNPHFIFNSLNSIESYIIRNNTKQASHYLNSFSRLVRLILQNSRSSYISLTDELETLELYLQLEQMRFKQTFSYVINLEESMDPDTYEIPPMLIQPYLENAIWHGLNTRTSGGVVSIDFRNCGDTIQCIIEDNGIGREAAGKIRAAQKVKRTSMGMKITSQRIDTINKIYGIQNEVLIEDLYNEDGHASGTRVTLIIPI